MPEQMIEIDCAGEGMVLARDLCDGAGAVLLPGGTTLSAAMLGALRRRGVAQLPVASAAQQQEQEHEQEHQQAALQAERQRQCQRLDHLFRNSALQGATPLLLAYLRSYRNGA
jgi:hypothetical protein